MAFGLMYASIEIRKAAWLRGIKNGLFQPVQGGANLAHVIGDNDKKSTISRENAKYAAQFTWAEIKNNFRRVE